MNVLYFLINNYNLAINTKLTKMIYWVLISAFCFIIMTFLVSTAPEYIEKEDGSMVPKEPPKQKKRSHADRYINEEFVYSSCSAAFLSNRKIKLPYLFSFTRIVF